MRILPSPETVKSGIVQVKEGDEGIWLIHIQRKGAFLTRKQLIRSEKLRLAIDEGRKRVQEAYPDRVFDYPKPEPLLPGEKFDLAAAIEKGRQRALEQL